MKPIPKVKIAVDAAMTLVLPLLMAYSLVGEAAHEWIGMGKRTDNFSEFVRCSNGFKQTKLTFFALGINHKHKRNGGVLLED